MTPAVRATERDTLTITGKRPLEPGMFALAVRSIISASNAAQRKAEAMPQLQRTISLQPVIPSTIVLGTATAPTRRTNMCGTEITTSCVPFAQRLTLTSGVQYIADLEEKHGHAHIKGGV